MPYAPQQQDDYIPQDQRHQRNYPGVMRAFSSQQIVTIDTLKEQYLNLATLTACEEST